MNTKIFTLIILLGFTSIFVFGQAQRKAVYYVGSGVITYFGDLTDRINFSYLNPVARAGAGFYLKNFLQIKGEYTWGRIEADDQDANDLGRVFRDLRFRNNISELSLTLHADIIPDKEFRGPYTRVGHFTPYVTAGLAAFYHNPKGLYEGEWHPLQPLGTEGQLIGGNEMGPYSRWQISVPLGLGISYRFERFFLANLEISYRKTFTDYLDDVSTVYPNSELLLESSGEIGASLSRTDIYPFEDGFIRGNPDRLDGYMFLTLTFGYLIY